MNYIIDAVVAAVIIISVIKGGRKGFIMTLASFVVIVAAFGGASMATKMLSPVISAEMEPKVYDMIDRSVAREGGISEEISIYGISLAGVSDVVGEFAGKAEESIKIAAAARLADAAANFITAVVSFIAIYIMLLIVFSIVNKIFRLPVLDTLNRMLGAVCGLAIGLVFVFFAVRISAYIDSFFTKEIIESTVLYKFFINLNF